MKFLIGLIAVWSVSTFTASEVRAQVLDPAWLTEKILQKKMPVSSVRKKPFSQERSPASLKGLATRERLGWKLVENQTSHPQKKVLLLPGFLGTDYVFHEMLQDPEMSARGLHLIAANAPGFAGQPVPENFDFTIDSYATLVEKLAREEQADILVGHSYMATVLTEVISRGRFRGKIVLISPALETDDEPLSTRTLNLLTLDPIAREPAWAGMYLFLEQAFAGFFRPGDDQHISIAASEARKTPISQAQAMLVHYFSYLSRENNSFVKTASKSVSEIHYVRGGLDVVTLKPENKIALKNSGKVTFHLYPGASHMIMLDQPETMNRLLLSL